MEPNDKQKAVAKMIAQQAILWMNSSDIRSSSHDFNLNIAVKVLVKNKTIDENDGEILLEALEVIYYSIIRTLK